MLFSTSSISPSAPYWPTSVSWFSACQSRTQIFRLCILANMYTNHTPIVPPLQWSCDAEKHKHIHTIPRIFLHWDPILHFHLSSLIDLSSLIHLSSQFIRTHTLMTQLAGNLHFDLILVHALQDRHFPYVHSINMHLCHSLLEVGKIHTLLITVEQASQSARLTKSSQTEYCLKICESIVAWLFPPAKRLCQVPGDMFETVQEIGRVPLDDTCWPRKCLPCEWAAV